MNGCVHERLNAHMFPQLWHGDGPLGGMLAPLGGMLTPLGGMLIPLGGMLIPLGGMLIPLGGVWGMCLKIKCFRNALG